MTDWARKFVLSASILATKVLACGNSSLVRRGTSLNSVRVRDC